MCEESALAACWEVLRFQHSRDRTDDAACSGIANPNDLPIGLRSTDHLYTLATQLALIRAIANHHDSARARRRAHVTYAAHELGRLRFNGIAGGRRETRTALHRLCQRGFRGRTGQNQF